MRYTLILIFCFLPLLVFGQDDGTTTNNWNYMPDLAPTEASWDYALSPAWYYWLGVGFGFFAGITGVMVKVFITTTTDAGDAGGRDD